MMKGMPFTSVELIVNASASAAVNDKTRIRIMIILFIVVSSGSNYKRKLGFCHHPKVWLPK